MTKPRWIRPIETRYRGYRFRSRLEARWAVFFDAIGMAWEYEPEGFVTNAGPYLPDFRLVGSVYVEVKPFVSLDKYDLVRWYEFACCGKDLVLLNGVPDPVWYQVILPPEARGEEVGYEWIDFVQTANHERLWPAYAGKARPEASWLTNIDQVVEACVKARGARFEHGERP